MLKSHLKLIIFTYLLGSFIGPNIFADNELSAQMKAAQEKSKQLIEQLQKFQRSQGVQAQASTGEDFEESESQAIKPDISNKETQRVFLKMLKRYNRMDLDSIKAEMLHASKGTRTGKVFKDYPKTLDFMARLYQSPDALPRALEMKNDMDKLKDVGLYMLGTIVFGFLLGKLLVRPSMTFMTRVMMGLVKLLIVWGVRGAIIVHFYGYYLDPMWGIFLEVFVPGFGGVDTI